MTCNIIKSYNKLYTFIHTVTVSCMLMFQPTNETLDKSNIPSYLRNTYSYQNGF